MEKGDKEEEGDETKPLPTPKYPFWGKPNLGVRLSTGPIVYQSVSRVSQVVKRSFTLPNYELVSGA